MADSVDQNDKHSRRIVRGGIAVFAGRVAGSGFAVLAHGITARQLDTSEYGMFLIFLTTVLLTSIVARLGLDRFAMKESSVSLATGAAGSLPGLYCKVLYSGTIAAVVLSVLCGGILYLPVLDTSAATWRAMWPIGSLALLLLTLLPLAAESLRGLHHISLATLFDAQRAGPLVNVLFILAMLAAPMVGVTASVFSVVCCYTVALLVCTIAALACLAVLTPKAGLPVVAATQLQVGSTWAPVLLSQGLPVMCAEFLAELSAYADLWIAGASLGSSETACLGVAKQIGRLIAMPLAVINRSILSSIPELNALGQMTRLQSMLRRSATVATAVTMPVLAVLIFFPTFVINTIYGPGFEGAALPLSILTVATLAFVLVGPTGFTLIFTGRQSHLLKITGVGVVALLAIGPAMAADYGIAGLAVVSAVTTIGRSIAEWLTIRHVLGIWTHATMTPRAC